MVMELKIVVVVGLMVVAGTRAPAIGITLLVLVTPPVVMMREICVTFVAPGLVRKTVGMVLLMLGKCVIILPCLMGALLVMSVT
jgi:hypothetical protein